MYAHARTGARSDTRILKLLIVHNFVLRVNTCPVTSWRGFFIACALPYANLLSYP